MATDMKNNLVRQKLTHSGIETRLKPSPAPDTAPSRITTSGRWDFRDPYTSPALLRLAPYRLSPRRQPFIIIGHINSLQGSFEQTDCTIFPEKITLNGIANRRQGIERVKP